MIVDDSSTTEPILVMQRLFDAPREDVWDALTDPRQVALWYGGHGFENPVCEMDVRPGGLWRHVMRTPDGSEHALQFVFVEVVKPERLVWRSADHGSTLGGAHDNLITVTLEAEGRKTRWRMVARFPSMADREAAGRMGFSTVLAEGAEKLNQLVKTS
jgi:uncharacterized protein YndB with AHSA1/START domain